MMHADPKGRSDGTEHASDPDPNAGPQVPPGSASGGEERGPARDIQSYIGTRLRAVFDDVAKQPIPDRFLDLMRQLDNS